MTALDLTRWQHLCRRLSLADTDETFEHLQAHYAQPHRAYHNAVHINECLARLDETDHPAADDPRVEFALWFHDAIYDTHSATNEADSARWAVETLRRGGADEASAGLVHAAIMATCHHHEPLGPVDSLVVDVDLSILGAPPARFEAFEHQIRQEYAWVPETTFRHRRLAVLRFFADRPFIYATDDFRRRFEPQARANLQRSIEVLQSMER